MRRLTSTLLLAAGAIALSTGPSARAADNTEPGPWDEVVFLPESSLAVLLERDPRGVLLERHAYLDLHRQARSTTPHDSGGRLAGVPTGVLRSNVDGVVEGDVARLRVRLWIAARAEGRYVVPLDIGGSIVNAKLGDTPATLGTVNLGGKLGWRTALILPTPGLHEAVIDVVAPVVKSNGLRTVSLALPAADAARWSLSIPGRVTATADGALFRAERLTDPDRTRLVAFGARGSLSASWREGDEGTDLPPLVRTTLRTLVEVGARAMDVRTLVHVDIARTPLDEIPLRLPEEMTVLGVDGDGASIVRGPDGAHALHFAEPFTGSRTVLIRSSRALVGPGDAALPAFDAPGATTIERHLGVRFVDGLRGFVDPGAGAERLDPAGSTFGPVHALLRVEADARPQVRTERPTGRLRAEMRALVDLADDGPWLTVSTLYAPRGDRLYGVDPLLPDGFLPESVEIAPPMDFLRGTTPDGRLSLVFPAGVDDGGAVTVTVRGRWPQPGWTDDAWAAGGTGRDAPLPRLDAGTRAETEGFIGVVVPAGTEVRDEESTGLVPAAVGELRERAAFAAAGLTLGWRFRGTAPGGRLRVTRPEASITATTALLVVPAEDHVSLHGTIDLAVQRGGVREVRLSVAPAVGDLLRIEGRDVAEKRRETSDDGTETWIVRFARVVRQGTTLTVRAELPLDADPVAVPVVTVRDAARARLEIGVAAAGELDVTIAAAGMRDADQAELQPVLASHPGGLLRAWRASPDTAPTLTVAATRLPPSPLPATFADSVALRSVVGMDGIVRTRLDARIRNVDRQALDVLLPDGARLSTARVAGKAVRPVRDTAGVLLVPIVPSPAPFDVVLVYEEPADTAASAATLVAPDLGIPGNRATWTVFLPEGTAPVTTEGDFSAPAQRPGAPLLLRWLATPWTAMDKRIDSGVAFDGAASAAAGPPAPARAAAPMPRPGSEPQAESPELEEDSPADDSRQDANKAPTTGSGSADSDGDGAGEPAQATRRIAGRAAERGLFGMDIHLLAAGPAITASRLGPTGTLHVGWRTDTRQRTLPLIAAVLALLAGVIARRRGVGAPTWVLVMLGALTALPVALATVDTSIWDGAAAGTLVFALVALFCRMAGSRRGGPILSRGVAAAALVLVIVGGTASPALAKTREPAPPPGAAGDNTVFVPYDPEHPTSLTTPEHVFLPYARYRELWNRAHPEERIQGKLPPVIVSASYAGRVEGRALTLEATYEVAPVDGGLVALPPGAAVDGLTLDGEPATGTSAAPGGATLVRIPAATDTATRVVLKATLRWPVGGTAPGGMVDAPLPRVPQSALTLDVPLADAVVDVTAAGGSSTAPADAGTRLDAALGAVDRLRLSWRPRGADAAGGRTRFEIESESFATWTTDALEWRADVRVRVLSGTIHEIDATIPAALQLTAVEGPALASWTVVDGTQLRLRLLGLAPGESTLVLRGVMPLADGDAPLLLPDITVADASSDRHRVAVSAAGRRVVPVERVGMERTDAAAGAAPGALSFRRVRSPSRLTVRAEPLPGGLVVAARHHLHLGVERSLARTELHLQPGPDGLHEARVRLPEGWTLDDHAGADVFPEAADGLRLVFAGAATSERRVVLRLRGPAAGDAAFHVPALRVEGAERESADVLVSTAPELAATVAVQENASSLPAERFRDWPNLGDVEVRALAWHTPRGAPTLAVRREALRSSARPTVVADVTVLDDRVIVDALLHWEVRGGPAREFRVDAPRGVRDAWVLGDGLREVRREDVDGRERLTVTLQAATTGSVAFRVLYELPIPSSGTLDVTGPEPVDGETARAFLLLRAGGEAEVRLRDGSTLETCGVADLPLVPQGLDPLRVLRFLRARDAAWTLPLELAAHALDDLPDARIRLVEGTTVADRDGSTRTRLEARLFNRARAFLPVSLPVGATLEAVVVGGVPVRPVFRASEPGIVLVPIRVQSLGEESQTVALTYRTVAAVPGGRFDELTPRLAEFPGVDVDATTWRLVLPADREYAFSGNLDPVEEVDVAIARAEAYASDAERLMSVYTKGSSQQQAVAAENIRGNAAEFQQTLDLARGRLDELAQAAAEGRVDPDRLRQSRRKAEALAKNIEEMLDEVAAGDMDDAEKRAADGYADPEGEQEKLGVGDLRTRYATKEGQAGKKWGSNALAEQTGDVQRDEGIQRQREVTVGVVTTPTGGEQPGGTAVASATLAFDNALKQTTRSVNQVALAAEAAATNGTIGIGGGAGGAYGKRFFEGSTPGSGGGGGGGGTYRYGGGAGAGGGHVAATHGDATRGGYVAGVSGLISLEPELVQEGRTYAFRKLESNAELEISTRTPDLGRRALALALLAVLVLAIVAVRRLVARRRG